MTIIDRRQFGKLCEQRGYLRGVEIGTDRADFARATLLGWPSCEEFRCIDPYEPIGVPPHDFPYDRTPDLIMAAVRLAEFVPAARIHRVRSSDAPPLLWFRPDFVYIDGAHDERSVRQDISTWWPLLASGGILAGHDYSSATAGVIAAVDAFAAAEGLSLNLTAEEKFPPSWWVTKAKA